MSRFYSSVSNGKSTQTKCGYKTDGLTAHIRGWNIGARIDLSVNAEGNDVVTIYKTSGSNNSGSAQLIATLTEGEL